MGQNSCQPEGLQPESAMAALLVLAIERLLPSPGALPSPILAATHACFIVLGTLDESLSSVHPAPGGDFAADGRHSAVGNFRLPAAAAVGAAGSRLPDDPDRH